MDRSPKIDVKDGKLIIKLPLTTPTGKVRVKHRNRDTGYGSSKATRKEEFEKDDYVEWQISYATENPPEDSKVEGITINDNQIGFELTKLLDEGLRIGILTKEDINELKSFIAEIKDTDTLEKNEKIFREDTSQEIKGGFKKYIEKVPIFIKENEEEGYFIEIILRHKQRATGVQAMVYLCIYIEKLKDINGRTLIDRIAKERELAQLEITSKNKTIILDTVRAFAIASPQHKNDILNILEEIEKKYT
jgi:hypothetical protein